MDTSLGSILITGATGFIGRRLAQRLVKDSFSVRCMVRQTASAALNGTEIVQGDLLEPTTLGKSLGGDTPRWVSTHCQPIAVDDVIGYLAACLTDERTSGRTFDIGGPEVRTYREMMERLARIEGRKLYIIPVPVLTPKLSSYWVGFITPVSPSVSMPLIEGLKNEVICREDAIRDLIPLRLTPYDEAVKKALTES
jgi:uncharacterized protein YbjT (DUF2867 family)